MPDDPPTVLAVDDEDAVVEVYALALRGEYDVRTAGSGRAALEAIDGEVDVVLLDRRMPGLSGREVLEQVREREFDVRVAMVTAVDPDFDVVEMPFDAYLIKPVTEEEIRAVVADLAALAGHDERLRELYAVTEKRVALEAEKTGRELAASDEYDDLVAREAALESRTTAALDDAEDATFARLVAKRPGNDGGTGGP